MRITDPADNDWIALAEVRGYKRGAQANDLIRIGRFAGRYAVETGKLPAATWYVVNHFITNDPSTRAQPLESNPSEVATFGEGGGLIIDTRDLFKLVMAVRREEIAPDAARKLLRSTGRFTTNQQ